MIFVYRNPSDSWLPDQEKQDLSLKSNQGESINQYGSLLFRRQPRKLRNSLKGQRLAQEKFGLKSILVRIL